VGDDARLIAAAPDLLEACRMALLWVARAPGQRIGDEATLAVLKAAITKAEGGEA